MIKKILAVMSVFLSLVLLIGVKLIYFTNYNNDSFFEVINYKDSLQYVDSNKANIRKIKVAIIDGEVDPQCFHNFENITQKIILNNKGDFDTTHATHLGSIIGGKPVRNKVCGLANGVSIYSYVVSDGVSSVEISNIVKAIKCAIEDKVDVINLSIGNVNNDENEHMAINEALNNNITIVSSFGNNGEKRGMYPALYDGVIAVSSINENNDLPIFANYGKGLGLVAPGVRISGLIGKDKYESLSGTSQSSAIVAALVALIKSKNKNLTPSQIKNIIEISCTKIQNNDSEIYFGNGIVNFDSALKQIK